MNQANTNNTKLKELLESIDELVKDVTLEDLDEELNEKDAQCELLVQCLLDSETGTK